MSTGTGAPDLRGARLAGTGQQTESGIAQGARLHQEAIERERAEQAAQRGRLVAPINNRPEPAVALPVVGDVVTHLTDDGDQVFALVVAPGNPPAVVVLPAAVSWRHP